MWLSKGWVVLCFITSLIANAPNISIASTSSTLSVPVQVYSKFSPRPSTNTAALVVPPSLDNKGTLTLSLKDRPFTRLLTVMKRDVPQELAFAFGEADRLYLRVYPPDDEENYRPEIDLTVNFPYDKSLQGPRTRSIQFLDAAGNPVKNFSLSYSLEGRFSAYKIGPLSLSLDENGIANLPVVIDPSHEQFIRRTQPWPLYNLYLTDQSTSQSYYLELMQKGEAPVTKVYVPTVTDPSNPSVSVANAKLITHPGEKQDWTTISLVLNYKAPVRSEVMSPVDPEVIYVTKTVPAPDGQFRIAVNSYFDIADLELSKIPVSILQGPWRLFRNTTATLIVGESNQINLPKRLSLTAQLIASDGKPLDLEDQIYESDGRFGIGVLGENGEILDQAGMRFFSDDTTGTVFTLSELLVPGRYQVYNRSTIYGPIDIGPTSPSEILKFRQIKDDGRYRGFIMDESDVPLSGTLIIAFTRYWDYQRLMRHSHRLTEIADLNTTDAMQFFDSVTSDVLDYTFTKEDGTFAISRKRLKPWYELPYIAAIARDRIPATLSDGAKSKDVNLAVDVTLPDLHLPRTGIATGVVAPPSSVPDPQNPGHNIPVSSGTDMFDVSHTKTWAWFNQNGKNGLYWHYDIKQTTGTYGKWFRLPIPLGTTYTLTARPKAHGLTSPWWRKVPFKRTDRPDYLATYRPQVLRPFYLKLVHADGTPGKEITVVCENAPLEPHPIDGALNSPITDENGIQLLYAGQNKTPQIKIANSYRSGVFEVIPSQTLDTKSSSVPTIVYNLDPKIWQVRGREPRGLSEPNK